MTDDATAQSVSPQDLPSLVAKLKETGFKLIEKNDVAAARLIFKELAELDRRDVNARFVYAQLVDGHTHKQRAESRDLMLSILDDYPQIFSNPTAGNLELIRSAAEKCAVYGPEAKAIELYRQLVSTSNKADDYFRLSEVLAKGGIIDESIISLEKAIALDPATYDTAAKKETSKLVAATTGSISDADLLRAAVPVPFALGPEFSSAPGPQWSEGPEATITVDLPERVSSHELLIIDARPFAVGRHVRHQSLELSVDRQFSRDWTLLDGVSRRRAVMVERRNSGQGTRVEIGFRIKTCPAPNSLELFENPWRRGIAILGVRAAGVNDPPSSDSLIWQLGRLVGAETQKTFDQRIETGFWAKYVRGPNILDIGFRGGEGGLVVPVLEGAIGVDIGYPGYDGRTLPFPDNSQDMVFSSHCLEHIPGHVKALQEWHRVLKIGGHMIIVVPHAHLYERRRRPPSRWNTTHERFYTPAALLSEVESALKPNSYRVRFCEENDAGYSYHSDPMVHPGGCYEVVLVLQKIVGPTWRIEE